MTKTNKESNKKVKLTPNQQFTKEIQALQKEITEARKQIEQLNERINSMIKSDGR